MARSLAVLSLLLSCFFASGLAVTCTEEHVGHTYTECTNGKRIATYYWSQPCEIGSYTLPSSIYNLPCDIECAAGQYLPFGGTQCLSCSKGKYSLGGGEVLSDWARLPDRMSTDCTGTRCSAWTANGTYLESGYNYQRDNIQSNLRLFARFLNPTGNLIRFSYTVDAESCFNCDGLMFYIDDQPMFTSLEPHQLRWATLEFNVSQGYHDFRWSYQKDYSITRGLDKVFIRSIELVGTTTAPEVCADCPAGTIGPNIGASQCTPCDYNTYSHLGQESCIPCLSNQYAFPGSPDCTNLVACQAKHIFSKRTPCNPATMTQNIEYHFITLGNGNVKVCDPANATSVPLPPTETNVPCICPPGQILDSNGACVHCPDGTARNSSQQQCEDCPIGTAALESLYLADWTALPSKVQTFCQGECDAQGWIPRGDHIDTGYGSGRQFQSFLSISEIELKSRGAVSGFYTLASCPINAGSPTCSLDIIFDNDQAEEVETRALAAGTNRTFSYILDPGNYTLTWRYTQRDTLITESTKVKLYRIIVSGVSEGGAPACIPCPAGSGASQPKSSRCTICGPGFYSPKSGGTCLPADPGYIARGSNSTRQIPCGANTTPNPERTDCLTDCTFTVKKANKTAKYDLNPLYNPESMNFAGTDTRNNQYFLNLCSREHNNASCFTAQGEPIPTFACQHVENWEFAVDLGNILGFVPNPEGNLSHFTVTMTEGAAACARVYNVSVPRATNITMICDLAAGLGAPRPSYGNGNVAEYPTPSCHYYFTWKSMYACPLCTSEDYQLTISDCVDGKKVKTFTRLTECFDPNPIPPEDIPCKLCPVENDKTCNAHGSCDDVSGACNCENSWAGDACELCSFGYYGENCLKECPGGAKLPCLGHGICSAGLNGNGSCACSTGWAGDLCDTCDSGFQGETCEAIPASVTDVVPWWGFVLIFGGLAIIVVSVIVLWKQKRNVEYKYSSLLKAQPLEMDDGDENVVGIPQDDSDPEGR